MEGALPFPQDGLNGVTKIIESLDMSYDIAVFDPRPELRNRATLEAWFLDRTRWDDDLDYDDPSNATPALQAWFDDVRRIFAPLTGPYAGAPAASLNEADYSLSTDIIYVGFAWPDSVKARNVCLNMAMKHGVAVLDVSDMNRAWFPVHGRGMELVHLQPTQKNGGPLMNCAASRVPDNLVLAILVTLCCVPTGIVSIVYAAQVNRKLASGDIAGAQESSANAKKWAMWSAIIGVVAITLYLILSVALGVGR